jgi:hypothetical protein
MASATETPERRGTVRSAGCKSKRTLREDLDRAEVIAVEVVHRRLWQGVGQRELMR